MLYAILCYNNEAVIGQWSKDHDDAVMARHQQVMMGLAEKGKLGPVARLQPTKTASTVRDRAVIDGPFAETKEQLLGFYVVDCPTLEDAVAAARDLRRANPTAVYEIRPILLYRPGAPLLPEQES